MNIGINRQAIIDNALSGCGTPAFSTSPEAPWSSKYTFQDNRVEEAKKLLEDAGWKDTDGDGIRERMA
ncbi:MAG: ABC transporter substrate-binding protein [Dialister invisus]